MLKTEETVRRLTVMLGTRSVYRGCLKPFQPFSASLGLIQYRYLRGHPAYIHPNPVNQPRPTSFKFKSKHANPKFRLERVKKVAKIDIPDIYKEEREKEKDLTPEEINTKMKEMGLQPPRYWNERPLYLASTAATFEPYIPPEGDGKAALLSKEGAKQKMEFLEKKGRSMMAVRTIRKYEEDFDTKYFAEDALEIYKKLHEALMKFDEKEMHKLATEKIYPMLVNETKYKTIRWKFHGSLEPSRVVHARYTTILSEDNLFAQLTVRFHTQQTLAVYDRFGRIIHGSEIRLRDVLEYVVFEKNISNTYGLWRVHDKIIPEWMSLQPSSVLTFKLESDQAVTQN